MTTTTPDLLVAEITNKVPIESRIAFIAGLQSVPSIVLSRALKTFEYELWDRLTDEEKAQLREYKQKSDLPEPQ